MNILLTSVGRRSYIIDYFRDAIGTKGKIIATNSIFTHAMTHANSAFISPLIYDQSYIPFIEDICRKESIDAILSLFDIDLPILAKNNRHFAKYGTMFVGPSYKTAIISNDKFKTYEFFASVGIKTPYTSLDLSKIIQYSETNHHVFPLIIKPRWGMGSIGVYTVRNIEELKVLYKKCLFEIENSYLKYESISDTHQMVIFQEFIDGQEYGLDIYKDLFGRFVTAAAKKKIEMRSGETDIGETVDIAPFASLIEKIAQVLEFTGLLSVDCLLAVDGVYGIEINPRISGHYPFSHLAGARYPQQLVNWLKGKETNPKLLSTKVGVRGCKMLTPSIFTDANDILR